MKAAKRVVLIAAAILAARKLAQYEAAMKSMSERMSEKEMRTHLAERGMTQQEIDAAIDTAKKEPPR